MVVGYNSSASQTGRKKRISLLFQADLGTPEALLIEYCREHPFLAGRDMQRKAMSAFYLPAAMRSSGCSEREVRRVAEEACRELHYQYLLLQQEFLADSGHLLVPVNPNAAVSIHPGSPQAEQRSKLDKPDPIEDEIDSFVGKGGDLLSSINLFG